MTDEPVDSPLPLITTDESVEALYSLIAPTEGVTTLSVCMDGTGGVTTFALQAGWNVNLKEMDDQEITEATMAAAGKEYQLTKEAILDITAHIGLPAAYVAKTPGSLIQRHLNYWATHSVDEDFKVLVARTDAVLAKMKKSITPFSNTNLLDLTAGGDPPSISGPT